MDKTRMVLKTLLKHCIAGWNAILTTSIAMLPRFIVITRQYEYLQYFFVNEMFFADEKKEMKDKGESNLTKNRNVIVSHVTNRFTFDDFYFFFFYYFRFKVFIKNMYKLFYIKF